MSPVSKGSGRIVQLDFLRGVAILLVLFWHMPVKEVHNPILAAIQWPGTHFGWAGVDLFFVLSGYLVGGLLMREAESRGAIDGKRFLIRRAFKIWPQYYVFLLLATLLAAHKPDRTPAQYIPSWFGVQNYLGSPENHLWSLAVEEHFYLLLLAALFVAASMRRLTFGFVSGLTLATAVVCLVFRVLAGQNGVGPVALQWQTHYRLDGLMFGVFLAALHQYRPELWERIGRAWPALLALALVGIGSLVAGDKAGAFMQTGGYTLVYLGAGAILMLARNAPGLARVPGVVALSWVGVYSYGVYLWHETAGGAAAFKIGERLHRSGDTDWLIRNGLFFAVGILVGAIMTRLVEIPTLKARDNLFPSRAPGAQPATEGPPAESDEPLGEQHVAHGDKAEAAQRE
jgi:peptidoglycan/LPS O-acetylase OafA/YrhL